MDEPTEAFREKYRAEGYTDGVIAERKQTLSLLQSITDSDDPEGAAQHALQRVTDIQAREASARAQSKSPGHSEAGAQAQIKAALGARSHASSGLGGRTADGRDMGDAIVELWEAQGRLRVSQ